MLVVEGGGREGGKEGREEGQRDKTFGRGIFIAKNTKVIIYY